MTDEMMSHEGSVPRLPATGMSILTDKRGATAIEYGLIAALIAVAAVGAMSGLGSQISKTFNNSAEMMSKG